MWVRDVCWCEECGEECEVVAKERKPVDKKVIVIGYREWFYRLLALRDKSFI